MMNSFATDIRWFVDHVGSIRRMLPPFASVAGMLTEKLLDDHQKFIEQHATDRVLSDSGELLEHAIPGDVANRYRFLTRALDDAGTFRSFLPTMALVTLVSVYDAYLGRLIRRMFEARPELLNSSNHQFTYAQLTEFPSVEAARAIWQKGK